MQLKFKMGFPGVSVVNNPAANARGTGSDLERSLEERNVNPLQYSCLENPMNRGNLVDYSPWDCKDLDMT